MVTDSDIKKFKAALAPEFDRLRNEIKGVENKVDALKTRIDTFEDNITGDIAKLQNENEVTSTYNQRLNTIEAKLAIAS